MLLLLIPDKSLLCLGWFAFFFFFFNINRLYLVLFSGLKWFCTARTSLSKCVSFFSGVVFSDGSSSIRSVISSPTKVESIAFCCLSSSVLYAVK